MQTICSPRSLRTVCFVKLCKFLQRLQIYQRLTIFAPHVNDQRQRIPHPDGSSYPVTRSPVPVSDLHVTLGR